jgi:uncharacterized protein (DUF58 family)
MFEPHIWQQARRLWVRARRAVATQMGGSQRSVFRGAGLTFEEVRPYEPGDDVRAIDWNVTARMGQPFVKRYVEERELPWMVMLDVSRSMAFGPAGQRKRDTAVELAALAAAIALFHADRVGLILFSDRIEAYLPPRKGGRFALRLLHTALFREPAGRQTRLAAALRFAQRVMPRRSLVLLLSDFQAEDYRRPLRALGRRHDLVAVRIVAAREQHWPDVGLISLADGETGRTRIVDSRRGAAKLAPHNEEMRSQLIHWLREAEADYLETDCTPKAPLRLLEYFQRRAGRLVRKTS